ncbi:MAG: hypothetical protein ACO1OX_10425 [Novosphingobium sp.]
MRRIMLAVGILAATPSAAQELNRASQSLELNATAPSACIVRAPRAVAVANATFQSGGDSTARVALTRLVDPNTALPRATSFEVAIPAACNASHRVTASSGKGGLGRIGAVANPGQGFAQLLPYALRLDWAGTRREQASNGGPIVLAVANGASGDVALRVNTPEGGTPLVAGDYDDTIVIQLQPND